MKRKKQPPKRTPVVAKVKVTKGKVTTDGPDVLPTVSVDVRLPVATPSMEWLRETATYIYTTSLQKVSLTDLAQHPLFAGQVSAKSLEAWCKQGGWVELRRQNAEAWRKQMTVETGRELVEFRREQLRKLRRLSDIMFKELLPDKSGHLKMPANSYESFVQAFVRVVGMSDEVTQKSLDDVMPDVRPVQLEEATEQSEMALKSSMSDEEARAGAKAILAMRRDQQRALVAQHQAAQAKASEEK